MARNDEEMDLNSLIMPILETTIPTFTLRNGRLLDGRLQDGHSEPQNHMPVSVIHGERFDHTTHSLTPGPTQMPGVRCPRCAERGIEQWVLPGKHCPRCNQPC